MEIFNQHTKISLFQKTKFVPKNKFFWNGKESEKLVLTVTELLKKQKIKQLKLYTPIHQKQTNTKYFFTHLTFLVKNKLDVCGIIKFLVFFIP